MRCWAWVIAQAALISTILPVKAVMPVTSRLARRRYERQAPRSVRLKKIFIPNGTRGAREARTVPRPESDDAAGEPAGDAESVLRPALAG